MAGQNGGIIPNNLHRVKNLNNSEKNFLFYMISLDNRFSGEKNDGFFFSRENMAQELGVSSLTTITNLINRLVELDLVKRTQLGKKLNNRYAINWNLINRIGKVKLNIGERIDLNDMAKFEPVKEAENKPIEAPKMTGVSNPIQEVKKPEIKPINIKIEPVVSGEKVRYQTSWNVPVVQAQPQKVEVRKMDEKPAQIPSTLYDMVVKRIPPHIYNVSFKDLEKEEVEKMAMKMIGKTGKMSFDTWKKNENMVSTPLWVSQLWTII